MASSLPGSLAGVVDIEKFALFTVGISQELHIGATELLLSVKDVQRMKK
jgi:hypothetical protein